jgi:hypothetical protein
VVKAADVLPRLETAPAYGDIHALDGPGAVPAGNVREGHSKGHSRARRRAV